MNSRNSIYNYNYAKIALQSLGLAVQVRLFLLTIWSDRSMVRAVANEHPYHESEQMDVRKKASIGQFKQDEPSNLDVLMSGFG